MLPYTSFSQNVIDAYQWDNDLKHYSTEAVPGTDDYVMAGTKYNGGDFNEIHFMYYQANNLVVSKTYSLASGDKNDIRVVDIAVASPDVFYITCLMRDNFNKYGGHDMIKVLGVDNTGTIISNATITSGGNNHEFDNIYPLHSLYQNEALFICGYVNDNTSSYPAHPYYGGPTGGANGVDMRQAFVIKYDIGGGGILTGKTWDYFVTNTSSRNDYDMAIRMIPLSNGDIYVTGSCNVPIVDQGGTSFDYLSGTLSIFLNTTTMTDYSNKPFAKATTPVYDPYYGEGEYGVGMFKDPNSGGYFVVGNYFNSHTPYAKFNFYPYAGSFWLTYLDANHEPPLTSPNNRSLATWGSTWALQNLEGNNANSMLVAGMTTMDADQYNNCTNLSPLPTTNNVNPFLIELSPSFNGISISSTVNYAHVYTSGQGTGVEATGNSYYMLGGGLSNVAWNPTFAARNLPDVTDITMSAPIWNNNNSTLNTKLIRTDMNGDISAPCDFYGSCSPGFDDEIAKKFLPTIIAINYNLKYADDEMTSVDYLPIAMLECDGGYYRQSNPNTANIPEVKAMDILPNPATDKAILNITGSHAGETIHLTVHDITGKMLQEYSVEATASKLQQTIDVVTYPKGLVFIQVRFGDGNTITQNLLSSSYLLTFKERVMKFLLLACYAALCSITCYSQYYYGSSTRISLTGSASSGYRKSSSTINILTDWRFRCNTGNPSTVGLVQQIVNGFPNGPGNNDLAVLLLKNVDTNIIRSQNYIANTGINSTYSMRLVERSCNTCHDSIQYRYRLLKYFNDFVLDSFLLSVPQNPYFKIDSSMNALTIYVGVQNDIFQNTVSLQLKNVTPGGIPYIQNRLSGSLPIGLFPPTHFYSRIYRYHQYSSISSPIALNKHLIIGIKGKSITYNPGYTDAEGDSISVTPLLLHVSDSSGAHPLVYANYSTTGNGDTLNATQRAIVKYNINHHAVPIQYYAGYSYQQPFGAGNWNLDSHTGQFSFTAQDTGLYLLAFRIAEYRNSQLLGDMMSYRTVQVIDSNVTLPVISNPFAINGAVYNPTAQTLTVCANNPMSYKVKATTALPGAQIVLESNAPQATSGAAVSYYGQSSDSAVYSFSWTPTKQDGGQHYVYVDAVDTACGPNRFPLHQSKGLTIIVYAAKIHASKTRLCKGETTTLQSWSTAAFRQWSVLSGDPSLPCGNCASITVSPSVTTTYVLEEELGACSGLRDTVTIEVVQPINLHARDTSFAGGIPAGYQLQIDLTPMAGYYTYTWLPVNKVDNYQALAPHPVNASNHNTYYITVKDTFNCFSQTDTLTLNQNTAGVDDLNGGKGMAIYPNPTQKSFTISVVEQGKLVLSNAEGKQIQTYQISKGATVLSLPSGIATGVYQLSFYPASGAAVVHGSIVYKP